MSHLSSFLLTLLDPQASRAIFISGMTVNEIVRTPENEILAEGHSSRGESGMSITMALLYAADEAYIYSEDGRLLFAYRK